MQAESRERVKRNAAPPAGHPASARAGGWAASPGGTDRAGAEGVPIAPRSPGFDTLDDPELLTRVCSVLARLDPRLCPGRWLHRRGLAALAAGDPARAARWLEVAALAYRRELAVAPLARLRVHQLMVHARATGRVESADVVEMVQRLNRLDQLERTVPPFELTDARAVLGEWLERTAEHERTGFPASLQAA